MTTTPLSRTALALASVLALAIPASAQAADVGSTDGDAVHANTVCISDQPCTLVGDNATVAADGYVTSWRLRSSSPGAQVRLRVLRRDGNGDRVGSGTGAVQTVGADPVSTFSERLPVKQGDELGIDVPADAKVLAEAPGTVYSFKPRIPDGNPQQPRGTEPGPRRLLLQATVEPAGTGNATGADLQVTQEQDSFLDGARRTIRVNGKITNNGPEAATGVVFRSAPRPGAQFASAQVLDPRCAPEPATPLGTVLRCSLGTMAPGETTTVPYDLTAATSAEPTLTNAVFASSDTPDPTPVSDQAQTFNIAPVLSGAVTLTPKKLLASNALSMRRARLAYNVAEAGVTIHVDLAASGTTLQRPPNPHAEFVATKAGRSLRKALFGPTNPLGGLPAGTYIATVVAVDGNGLVSAPKRRKFRVFP